MIIILIGYLGMEFCLMYKLIMAVGRDCVIGHKGKLPWNLPSDLKRFKEVTMWSDIIMGRKTFESLPGILPGRRHIVLTRDTNYRYDHEDVVIVNSVDELVKNYKRGFVIGGAEVVELLIPHISGMILSVVESGELVEPKENYTFMNMPKILPGFIPSTEPEFFNLPEDEYAYSVCEWERVY